MDWFRKISLFMMILTMSFSLAHVSYGAIQNKLDASLYFYPAPALASKTYPNLFFQVGSNIHVRDALTGEIKQILKLDEGEGLADCDRDSVLLYCPNQSNDDQISYKRIDLDGTTETFIFKKIIIAGQKRDTQNISFINNKPYFFYETGGTYNKSYKFTVQSPEGILWTSTNGENETWLYNGCFSYKDKQIVAISVIVCQKDFLLRFFDLSTGKQINTLEGCFDRTNSPNSDSPIIPFNMCSQGRGLCLYDIRKNEIVYKRNIPNWYYTKYFDNAIWLTTVEDSTNQYRYDTSGPIRIIKIGLDGKELENFTITPTLPNLPIYSFQIATNQVGALLAKHKTILYNFRTNQKLLELDIDLPEIFSNNGRILLATTSELVCIDEETLEPVWKLNIARTAYIEEFETNKNIYLLNNVYDHKKQCDATQVRIINKADGSLEPYEFFVSPFYYDQKKIYDSPYGLIFIRDNNICSFAVGGVERFKITDISSIESWRSMEDPKFVEIKTRNDRTYMLDTKTGVFRLISKPAEGA